MKYFDFISVCLWWYILIRFLFGFWSNILICAPGLNVGLVSTTCNWKIIGKGKNREKEKDNIKNWIKKTGERERNYQDKDREKQIYRNRNKDGE